MSKILICGYYGFNNLGDEAILESTLSNLRKKFHDIDISVLSACVNTTEKKYNVKGINRNKIFMIIKSIFDSDLIVFGGGSLLQDATSKRSIIYYLGIMFISLLMGKEIFLYSQGIGPIKGPFVRKLTKIVLNKIKYITVRDINSKKDLIEMGVTKPNIKVTSDPVIGVDKPSKDLGLKLIRKYNENFDVNKATIGFAFRDWSDKEKLRKVLVETSNKLKRELDANIIFIPFHHEKDLEIINDIEDKLDKEVILIKDSYGMDEILSVIGNLDLLVGVRLHSLIFSAVNHIPMIAISYDPKINYFMESLGLDVFCDIDELNTEKLNSHIKKLLQDKENNKNYSIELQNIKEKLEINDKIVEKLLQKGIKSGWNYGKER